VCYCWCAPAVLGCAGQGACLCCLETFVTSFLEASEA
jgi:hypothetical protein